MKRFSDFKIRTKIMGGCAVILLFTIFIGLFSLFRFKTLSADLSEAVNNTMTRIDALEQIRDSINNSSIYLRDFAVFSERENKAMVDETYAQLERNNIVLRDSVQNYLNSVRIGNLEQDTLAREAESLNNLLNEYSPMIEATIRDIMDSSVNESIIISETGITKNVELIKKSVNSLYEMEKEYQRNIIESTQDKETVVAAISVIFIVLSVIIGFFISLGIEHSLVKPINEVSNSAKDIANGKFETQLNTLRQDEIGDMARSLSKVRDTLLNLMQDMEQMAYQQGKEGNLDYYLNEKSYQGTYQNVAAGVNQMMKASTDSLFSAISTMEHLSDGDFNVQIHKYPGKKSMINESLEHFKGNLSKILDDINSLTQSAVKGDLSHRIDETSYKGDWQKIIAGLNVLMSSLIEPIEITSKAIQEISVGNLDFRIRDNLDGDFNLIKVSFNKTVENLSAYVNDIRYILSEITNQNLDLEINRDYEGDFAQIKVSLNLIITQMNKMMDQMNIAGIHMSEEGMNFTQASELLAQGASEQSGSIAEINNSIDIMMKQTSQNAKQAQSSMELADQALQNAQYGNLKMSELMTAMEGIDQASKSILQVIRTIEEIAKQTHILAINASVEASRAGEHGKGFGVVAGEVKALAERSKQAVKETAELIMTSGARILEGRTITDETVEAFEKIVIGITETSNINKEISVSSEQQESSFRDFVTKIREIAEITHHNASISQELSASAQELSAQAEEFKNTTDNVKRKRM